MPPAARSFGLRHRLPDLAGWPAAFGILGAGLVLAVGAGPVSALLDGADAIAAARERLVRAGAAASRPPVAAPLAAPEAAALLAAFRARLDALAAGRAALVDRASVEADPGRPALPRLRAELRGTAEGLHGLLHALETEAPLVVVEEAELDIDRAADPEIGRPTIMHLAVTVRGVLTAPEPAAPGRSP